MLIITVAITVVTYITAYAMSTRVIDCASVCEANGFMKVI